MSEQATKKDVIHDLKKWEEHLGYHKETVDMSDDEYELVDETVFYINKLYTILAKSLDSSKPVLKLAGEDGNAYSILGRARKVLMRNGMKDKVEEFTNKATSGDYNHLLATCVEYFSVE